MLLAYKFINILPNVKGVWMKNHLFTFNGVFLANDKKRVFDLILYNINSIY